MSSNTRDSLTSAINNCIKSPIADRYIGDIHEKGVLTGIFVLMYDDNGKPYVAALNKGVLIITAISNGKIKAAIDKVEDVYSFPNNPANVSRVLLIALYKLLETAWRARLENAKDSEVIAEW